MRDVLQWLCWHDCCSWGEKGEVKIRRGQVLSSLLGQSQKKWEFHLISTVHSFEEFGVFSFFNLYQFTSMGLCQVSCAHHLLTLQSIHLLVTELGEQG